MKRVTISDLLEYISEDRINENVISTFKSLEKNDIENFLYNKATAFEKNSISTTHLIFTDNDVLLGYFSLANKSLILSKERLEKLSNTKKKRLMQSGQILENGHLVVNSYLIGQLGKNYNLPQEGK